MNIIQMKIIIDSIFKYITFLVTKIFLIVFNRLLINLETQDVKYNKVIID